MRHHDHRNDVLDDQFWPQDSHRAYTDARLCSSVRGSKAAEDDGCRTAHGAEKGALLDGWNLYDGHASENIVDIGNGKIIFNSQSKLNKPL